MICSTTLIIWGIKDHLKIYNRFNAKVRNEVENEIIECHFRVMFLGSFTKLFVCIIAYLQYEVIQCSK